MVLLRTVWGMIAGSRTAHLVGVLIAGLGAAALVLRRERRRTIKLDRLERYHDTRKAADEAPIYRDADRARVALTERLSRIRNK